MQHTGIHLYLFVLPNTIKYHNPFMNTYFSPCTALAPENMKLRTAGEECLRLRGELRSSSRRVDYFPVPMAHHECVDDGWERATYQTWRESKPSLLCYPCSQLNVRYAANDRLARTTIVSQLKYCDRMPHLVAMLWIAPYR